VPTVRTRTGTAGERRPSGRWVRLRTEALRTRLRAMRPAKAAPSGAPLPAKSIPSAPDPAPAPAPVAAPLSGRRAARSPAAALLRILIMLVAFVGMVAFAGVLARLTLTPSHASVGIAHSNLHPGESLRLYMDQPSVRDAVKQIGGNLALGLPFGVLAPVLAPKARGLLRVLVVTAAVMLLVELVQGAVIAGRSFDIDDVILNTTGSLLGYLLLGRRIARAVHPPRPHWWQRRRPARSDTG
jgi:glycopeptide antibiotics resistance protein